MQCLDTAQSIITGFRENLHTNPQARIMWRAMNLTQGEQTSQNENENKDDHRTVNTQIIKEERNTQKTNTRTHEDNKRIHDKSDQSEQKDSKRKDKHNRQRTDQRHCTKTKKDKKDENEPNG